MLLLLTLFLLEIEAKATFNCGCSSIVLVDVKTNQTIEKSTEVLTRKTTTKPEVRPIPISTTPRGKLFEMT